MSLEMETQIKKGKSAFINGSSELEGGVEFSGEVDEIGELHTDTKGRTNAVDIAKS